MHEIWLNGEDWQFKGFIGEDWLWRDAHRATTKDVNHWFLAAVPGSVFHDLWINGQVENPHLGVNSLKDEWVPARTWVYKKKFWMPHEFSGKQVRLTFYGVDYRARIYLNGVSLGEHTGLFTPFEFDVSECILRDEENLLAVVIDPAPPEQPQVGYSSRVRTLKPRMNYWWDFCPRMIHQGIWQGVKLSCFDACRIQAVDVRQSLSEDLSRAELCVSTRVEAAMGSAVSLTYTFKYEGAPIARVENQEQITAAVQTFSAGFTLENPRLWFPNGQGDQPLYTAEVELHSLEDRETDSRSVTVGIRKARFLPNEDADPEALPYVLEVNHQKVFIQGWNWTPIDAMYGVPQSEKLLHLLNLAQKAHVNLLRVWGGGLIETEEFYDICDRMGIFIWQEFTQSSSGIENLPPDDPKYVRFVQNEARQIIPLKCHHPSLLAWCGGNELSRPGTLPCQGDEPLLAALEQAVHELDPGRAWFPTSPSGKHFAFDLRQEPDAIREENHDTHGPWEYQGMEGQYSLYNGGGDSLLHSEFGVEGLTNLATLRGTLPPDYLLPISLTNPVWEHRGAWWVKEKDWKQLFGEWESLEMAVMATQFMQAEGLRYAIEADRCRQYHNSGTIPWQLNEPFPMAACTSAVDYYGYPKPAYYAVCNAYETLHFRVQYERINPEHELPVKLFYSNSGGPVSGTLRVSLQDFAGKCIADHATAVECVENASRFVTEKVFSLQTLTTDPFFLDLHFKSDDARITSANRILFSHAKNLRSLFFQPTTSLDIRKAGGEILIKNTGSVSGLGVWIEPVHEYTDSKWLYFSQNYFHLFPGETQAVIFVPANPSNELPQVRIKGWNTPAYTIDLSE